MDEINDNAMTLLALPPELLLHITTRLQLSSIIRLGATCRQLRQLVDSIPRATGHLAVTLYFALVRKDVETFTNLCHDYILKLPSCPRGLSELSASQSVVVRQEFLAIQDGVCACMYLLVASLSETDSKWWAPLEELSAGFKMANDAFSCQFFFGGWWFPDEPDADWFPSQRVIEDALLYHKHFDAVEHMFDPSRADNFAWFISKLDMPGSFVRVCSAPMNDAWTNADRTEALALLVRLFSKPTANPAHESEPLVALSRGFRYHRIDEDEDVELGYPSQCRPLNALVSTNALALIVSIVLLHSSFVRRHEFHIHIRRLLDACLTNGNRPMLQLLMKSYLITIAPTSPNRPFDFDHLIEFPAPHITLLNDLCNEYASHGVSRADCLAFLECICSKTDLLTHMIPWLLGKCPLSRNAHLRIKWLLDHVHLHQSTLHLLPFNSANIRTSKSLQLIVDRVPVDIICMHTHTQLQHFDSSNFTRTPSHRPCSRCASITAACAPHLFDAHLARFASRVWVVSLDPIPESQLRNEARAVAKLLAQVSVEDGTAVATWEEYREHVRKCGAAKRGTGQLAAGADVDVGEKVEWAGAAGSYRVNCAVPVAEGV